ncbi:hypothetical protein OU415_35060 [Saccharopolyspora sp. WRP15-2]|uniref:Uncharacterized protein n=1 Tax=Saccharopolyspora oryzae TaxID=2997343 RepID=A0ABT4VBN1_9PSEU|nr:hypothetical protein [Saccharopolyspora oryzae]MDA3630692.1 hypothetical protein [Saccharopolyspora oryzae]
MDVLQRELLDLERQLVLHRPHRRDHLRRRVDPHPQGFGHALVCSRGVPKREGDHARGARPDCYRESRIDLAQARTFLDFINAQTLTAPGSDCPSHPFLDDMAESAPLRKEAAAVLNAPNHFTVENREDPSCGLSFSHRSSRPAAAAAWDMHLRRAPFKPSSSECACASDASSSA